MIELCHGSIEFPLLRDRRPDTRNSLPCHFSGPVIDACCVLTGFLYGYTDADHHVWRTTINLECRIDRDVVTVVATYGFRDSIGNWDGRDDDTINFCVIANVRERDGGFVSALPSYGLTAVFKSLDAAKLPCETLPLGESSKPASAEQARQA